MTALSDASRPVSGGSSCFPAAAAAIALTASIAGAVSGAASAEVLLLSSTAVAAATAAAVASVSLIAVWRGGQARTLAAEPARPAASAHLAADAATPAGWHLPAPADVAAAANKTPGAVASIARLPEFCTLATAQIAAIIAQSEAAVCTLMTRLRSVDEIAETFVGAVRSSDARSADALAQSEAQLERNTSVVADLEASDERRAIEALVANVSELSEQLSRVQSDSSAVRAAASAHRSRSSRRNSSRWAGSIAARWCCTASSWCR